MFDNPFQDCLKSNVSTVKWYNLEKYVMGHLYVSQDEPKMTIQSQLGVLKFTNE